MKSPQKLIERLLDLCATLAVSAYLLRLTARWLMEAAPYLLIAAAIILIVIIGYRIYCYHKNSGNW